MIPEKDKTYKIDYWTTSGEPGIEETFYKGKATFLGETEESEDGETLYLFKVPDNALTAWFGEEDIIEEVK